MKLKVVVNKMTFVVPCGDGKQSVKWLGLVAAQRHLIGATAHIYTHTRIFFARAAHGSCPKRRRERLFAAAWGS